jgi:DNA-binding transcriptional LysR family regulator
MWKKRLVVAIDELYPERALATLFAEFAARFPHVELELLFPMMEDVSRLVLDGKADIGVMWRQETLPAALAFHTIGWVPLKLVCGRNHPLAATAVDWEELKALSPADGRRAQRRPGKTALAHRRRSLVGESHWVILQMVMQGIGWALVPDHIIENSPAIDGLVTPTLQFDDADWPVALEMVWHKQKPSGPAAEWLRERFASTRINSTPG